MEGLYDKYIVLNKDGTPTTGRYFVLKPETDDDALAVLAGYAARTQNEQLAYDLWQWINEILTAR